MKKLLGLTAVLEGATGLALLILPSLVGWLLLGTELTGVANRYSSCYWHRLGRIRNCLLAKLDGALRHVDL